MKPYSSSILLLGFVIITLYLLVDAVELLEQKYTYDMCIDAGKVDVYTDMDIVILETNCSRRSGYYE